MYLCTALAPNSSAYRFASCRLFSPPHLFSWPHSSDNSHHAWFLLFPSTFQATLHLSVSIPLFLHILCFFAVLLLLLLEFIFKLFSLLYPCVTYLCHYCSQRQWYPVKLQVMNPVNQGRSNVEVTPSVLLSKHAKMQPSISLQRSFGTSVIAFCQPS